MRWLLSKIRVAAKAVGIPFLQKEDGGFLLKEDGGKIILE